LDAGSDRAPEGLPVGAENPVILLNDGPRDNWHGEYALLLARMGGPPLAGIVVGASGGWFDLEANLSGWKELVSAARASGLESAPEPVRGATQPLRRPADERVESTIANASQGARFIVDTSLQLARPGRPVVVASGAPLTDVAAAYLLDPTVVDRVVVVASLGSGFSEDRQVAVMGAPNGELDPWASAIVIQKFRYVQVSAHYDQLNDVPAERVAELPDNDFGVWMAAKRADIFALRVAADQVSVIALGIPEFTRDFVRVSQSGWESEIPTLAPDLEGNAWLVTASDGAAATNRLWQMLLDPATFAL
jgi:hypothetical protein